MYEVNLKTDDKGHGHFYIMEGDETIGEMEINMSEDNLTVYHTEVLPEHEGKGLARIMLDAMVDHARKNNLKVTPLCPYVHLQFKRHPQEFADIWNRSDK